MTAQSWGCIPVVACSLPGSLSRIRGVSSPLKCSPPGAFSLATFSFYLYGDQAAGTVARETPLWQAWIQKRFPMPTEPGKSE